MIDSATDKTAVIGEHAFGAVNPSKLCAATVEMFASILAAEASNLALRVLATGGVYIAGGVAVHVLPLRQPAFMQSFKRKGRFEDLMGRIPIHVIVSPAGLAGAAVCGLEASPAFKPN